MPIRRSRLSTRARRIARPPASKFGRPRPKDPPWRLFGVFWFILISWPSSPVGVEGKVVRHRVPGRCLDLSNDHLGRTVAVDPSVRTSVELEFRAERVTPRTYSSGSVLSRCVPSERHVEWAG